MSLLKLDKTRRTVLIAATALSIVVGFWFLQEYLILVIFAAIMAILFNPVHDWYVKKGKSLNKATVNTFILSTLTIIIPLIFVIIVTVLQINSLLNNIAEGDYSGTLSNLLTSLLNAVNEFLAWAGINYTVTVESITASLAAAVSTLSESFFQDIISSFAGIFEFITAAIIYIYVFMSILKNKAKIIDTINKLNPLGNEISDLYNDRVNSMTKATVRGQFIIAAMQGVESALVLTLTGPSDLFFFWLLLLTVLSVIPLGAGIVTIPVGVLMILTGNIWGGIIVIANHLLIVTNIDNIMRPKLVPKNARLDPALMILAVFSGMALFGFLGIVIGPIIMILLVTTIQIFNEVFYKEESIDRSKGHNEGALKRLVHRIRHPKILNSKSE